MYELLPFWHALFTALGFEVVRLRPFSAASCMKAGQAHHPFGYGLLSRPS
ncbi:MAG: hypothetical protein ACLUHE_00210 [Christensenellales bacterium]